MKNLSKIKERILLYLKCKGISNSEFYKISGISNGILSQNNGMTEDNIMKFLTTFDDISVDWLLLGEGEMLRKEPYEGSKISAVASAPQSNAAAGDIKIEAPTALLALLTQQQDTIARQASTIAHLTDLLAQRSPQLQTELSRLISIIEKKLC